MNVNIFIKKKRVIRTKLIFNPSAGASDSSSMQLMDVIRALQSIRLIPETFLIEEGCDLPGMMREALSQGIRLFVVCGGDSTISAVARLMVGTHASLGIIPLGTKNNIAISLGIPTDITAAIAILRSGQKIKVDMGLVSCGKARIPFLEVCSVGLISTLFPAADDIQHGNLARIGEFLTSLTSTPPAEIQLLLDNKLEIHDLGHVVLVSNMPYIGLNYKVGSADSFKDGLLDVLFFGNLSKLDLLGYVFQGVGAGDLEDPRIQRFHVRRVDIKTLPLMPIMIDGVSMGEGHVQIELGRHALRVIVGQPTGITASDEDLNIKESDVDDTAIT